MDWATAKFWATNLNPYSSGISGWRLPTFNPIDGTTADDYIVSYTGREDRGWNVSAPGTVYENSAASEMAHLFYNTLGNKGQCDPSTSTESSCTQQAGFGLANTGPFTNFQSNLYWSATEYALDTEYAWYFGFNNGIQNFIGVGAVIYALAVREGDVGAVPIPAAAWLFGTGLMGLAGVARRKKR